MYNFQSDYLEGCAPEILEELIKTNNKQQKERDSFSLNT